MRVFLVIMMLAIALSGFSTASHALGMKNCHSESSIDAKVADSAVSGLKRPPKSIV